MAGEVTLKLTIKGGADGSFNATIDSARKSVKGLGDDGERSSKRVSAGFNGTANAVLNVRSAIDYAKSSMIQYATAAAAFMSVGSVIRMADAYTNLSSKIRLVTSSESEAAAVRQKLFAVAQNTRQEFEATAELYTRLARSTAQLGLSNQQLLGITETINQAFVVSGASAQEASNAIIQLSQGLSSGALRGEEFNSVAEQAPIIMEVLSKSLGKSRGELRKMAEAGELTAAVLTGALQDGAAGVAAQFAQMDVTVGGAFVQLKNALMEFVGSSDAISGAMSGLVTILQFVAKNLDTIAAVATVFASVLGATLAQAAIRAAAQMTIFQASTYAAAGGMTAATVSSRALAASMALLAANPIAFALLLGGAAIYGTARVIQIAIEQDESFERTIAEIDKLDSKSIDIDLAIQFGDERSIKEIEAQLSAVRAESHKLWDVLGRNREEVEALQNSWWKTADTWNRINELNAEFNEGLGRQRNLLEWVAKFTDMVTAARERAANTAAVGANITSSVEEMEKETQAYIRKTEAIGKTESAMVALDLQRAMSAAAAEGGGALTLEEAAALAVAANANQKAKEAYEARLDAYNAGRKVITEGIQLDEQAKRAAEELANANANLTGTLIELRVENGELTDAQGSFAAGMLEVVATTKRLRDAKVDEAAVQEFLTNAVNAQNRAFVANTQAEADAAAAAAYRADVVGRLLADLEQETRLSAMTTEQRRVEEIVLRAVADAQQAVNDKVKDAVALSPERQAALRLEVAGQLKVIDANEAAQQAAKDAAEAGQRAWTDFAGDLVDAMGRGMDGVKDLFKRMLADLLRQLLQSQVLRAMSSVFGASMPGLSLAAGAGGQQSMLGAMLGGGGSGGGLLGGLLGGVGGLFGGGASGGIFAGAGALQSSLGALATGGGGFLSTIASLAGPVGLLVGAVAALTQIFGEDQETILRVRSQQFNGDRRARGVAESDLGSIFVRGESLGDGAAAEIAGRIKEFDNLIAGLLNADQLAAVRERLSAVNDTFRDGAATVGEALDARFSAILGELSTDVQAFVGTAGELEDRVGRLAEALQIESLVELETLGDTFGDVAAMIQEYRVGTEEIGTTYARLIAGAQLFEAALGMAGVAFDGTRQELIAFSADIVQAAGGLERAQSLWSAYFDTFYSADERAAYALSQAQANATAQAADIGLNASDFAGASGAQQFRDLFESMLPTLSAEAVVEWLEFAAALGVVLDLTGEATGAVTDLSEALAAYQDFVEQFAPSTELATGADAATVSAAQAQADAWADAMIASANAYARAAGFEGAAAEDLANIHTMAAGYVAQAAQRLRAEYDGFVAQFAPDLTPATGEGAATLLDAQAQAAAWAESMIASANTYARAAGMEGAAAEDLANIHTMAAGYIATAAQRLIAEYDQFVAQFAPSTALPTGVDASSIAEAQAQADAWEASMIASANAYARAAGFEGAAAEDLANIHTMAAGFVATAAQRIANAAADAAARQAAALERYADVVGSVRDALDEARGMSDFARELRDIDRWLADTTESMNDAARAAGRHGAAEEDLATAHEVAAIRAAQAMRRLMDAARSVVERLYGPGARRVSATGGVTAVASATVSAADKSMLALDGTDMAVAKITTTVADLEDKTVAFTSAALDGIDDVVEATEEMYNAQVAAQQRIRDWLDNLLLGDLGGLRPRDAIVEAQALFDRTLAAAQGGDAEAMAALPGIADQLLRLGQQVYASSEPYFELRDSIVDALEGVAAMQLTNPGPSTGGGGRGGGGGGGGVTGPSPGDIQQILDERRELANELVEYIRDLVAATGQPLTDIGEQLGFSMRDLIADLGISLSTLTVETASQLAGVAQSMGVNLTELAQSVGVDLGELSNAQSLINDALEAEVSALPPEQAAALQPMLQAIEQAAASGDTAGVEAGIDAMERAINEMGYDVASRLAPYFAGVSVATGSQSQQLASIATSNTALLTEQRNAVTLLRSIATNTAPRPGATAAASYAVGTAYVPSDGLAMIHRGEAIFPAPVAEFFRREGIPMGGNNDALVAELRALRTEQREDTRRVEARVAALETATREGAQRQSAAVDRQTDAIRRTR